jgi:nucleotide-binding universal stress UspA family protein
VLAATDCPDAASPTLQAAAREARARGVGLTLLHCVEVAWRPAGTAQADDRLLGPSREALEAEQGAIGARLREAATMLDPGADVVIGSGEASRTIVVEAEVRPVELVVIGSHGAGGFRRRLLGSVAERVVRNAPCPVLLVRS